MKAPAYWPPVGSKMRLVLGATSTLYHVLAIIHDDGHAIAVVKRWRASKQRWHYECLDLIWLSVNCKYITVKP